MDSATPRNTACCWGRITVLLSLNWNLIIICHCRLILGGVVSVCLMLCCWKLHQERNIRSILVSFCYRCIEFVNYSHTIVSELSRIHCRHACFATAQMLKIKRCCWKLHLYIISRIISSITITTNTLERNANVIYYNYKFKLKFKNVCGLCSVYFSLAEHNGNPRSSRWKTAQLWIMI